jgi:ribonuclease R
MKKKNKQKNKPVGFSNKRLYNFISDIFKNNPSAKFNYKQIAKKLNIKDENIRKQIIVVLKKMLSTGFLEERQKGSFFLGSFKNSATGVVKNSNKKGVYVVLDNGLEVFVDKQNSCFALADDRVELVLFSKKNKKQQGEIVSVLERNKLAFTGFLDPTSLCFLIPDDNNLYFDIFIPQKDVDLSFVNKKLLVGISSWSNKQKSPVGKIKKVLGEKDSSTSALRSIVYNYGFSPVFSPKTLSFANNISDAVSVADYSARLDYRDVPTFTIDPEDARDFDDALSVKKIQRDVWEVGVHIADVSHFVKSNDLLDKEAFKRATSVYLSDRVIPMLPENISNHVCSLKPNVDRLAYSVLFKIKTPGEVLDFKICETVIHSNYRFTYKSAQEVINKKQGVFCKELLVLDNIYKKLRSQRFSNGSINFESSEIQFVLNKKNDPINVYKKEILSSNHLIEEFMLLANKTIAKHICLKELGFIYRVHESPDLEKIDSLSKIIKPLSLSLKNTDCLSNSLNDLLSVVKGKKEEKLIETLVLRSMAKAVYSTRNIGHFGLGFDFYSHFTSPIRRYPDLITHRLLKRYLSSRSFSEAKNLDNICSHCSKMEKNAVSAERASSKYMQTKYLSNKIGCVFSGVVSGVTEWGFYVELSNGCEGLVRLSSLKDDHYVYNEKQHSLTGVNSKRLFLLGSVVKIKVKSVSLEKSQTNFITI